MKHTVTTIAATIALMGLPVMADQTDSEPLCETVELTIYFAVNDASLSEAATYALDAEAKQVSACEIAEIKATVFSADATTKDAEHTLAAARSTNVLTALMARGVQNALHETPVTLAPMNPGQDNRTPPLARRVEVKIIPTAALNS